MTLLKPDFISSTNLALGRKMRDPNTICWRDELYYLSYKNHSNHLSQLQNTNELYCESVCIFWKCSIIFCFNLAISCSNGLHARTNQVLKADTKSLTVPVFFYFLWEIEAVSFLTYHQRVLPLFYFITLKSMGKVSPV